MVSLLRTRAARRWLTWLSVAVFATGAIGLAGGFEPRVYPSPPTALVGQPVETTRFVFTVTKVEWGPASAAEPRLTVHLSVLNTSQETSIVPRWLIVVRLPDGSVLPHQDESLTFVTKDGPGRFFPLIEAPATLRLTQGVPAERPEEVSVFVLDETLAADEGVYTEAWQPGQPVAEVVVPVEEAQL